MKSKVRVAPDFYPLNGTK